MSTPRLEKIETQRNALWTLSITLLGALSATLVLVSLTSLENESLRASLEGQWQMLVGLGGLVVLFALYATKKRRQLATLQQRMQQLAVREASLKARLSELSFLFDTSTQIQLRLDLQSMLELASQRLLACFEAHQSSIMLHNAETGMVEVKAASGVDAALVTGSAVRPGEGIAGTVYATGESLLLNDALMEARFKSEIKPGRSITSSLCVPLRSRGSTIGIVNVSRSEGSEEFEETHLKILESFAEHCAATILKTNHHHQVLGARRAA